MKNKDYKDNIKEIIEEYKVEDSKWSLTDEAIEEIKADTERLFKDLKFKFKPKFGSTKSDEGWKPVDYAE